jgi:hypothetical protein
MTASRLDFHLDARASHSRARAATFRTLHFSAPRDDTARAGYGNRAKSDFLL